MILKKIIRKGEGKTDVKSLKKVKRMLNSLLTLGRLKKKKKNLIGENFNNN
jgi:hypothetical protein